MARANQSCTQEGATFGGVATFQHVIHAVAHFLRADVGQEAESTAVHAEQRDGRIGGQSRGIQHGAVATDCHDQVGLGGKAVFRDLLDRTGAERQVCGRIDQDAASSGLEMGCQRQHGVPDAGVEMLAEQCDGPEVGRARWTWVRHNRFVARADECRPAQAKRMSALRGSREPRKAAVSRRGGPVRGVCLTGGGTLLPSSSTRHPVSFKDLSVATFVGKNRVVATSDLS